MKSLPRFSHRSIRGKVMLLIVFWAGLTLGGQVINGYLGMLNAGDGKLLADVYKLRNLPQSFARAAIGILNGDTEAVSLRVGIEGYRAQMAKFAPMERGEMNPRRRFFPDSDMQNRVRQYVVEKTLRDAHVRADVAELRGEWGRYEPLFSRIAVFDTAGISSGSVNEAVDLCIKRTAKLIQTIEKKIEERQDLITRVNIAVLFGSLGTALLVFLLLHRIILAPLENLRGAAASFAENDLSARARIFYPEDEIGKLARTFNVMVETVAERERIDKERLAEIKSMNEELVTASKMKSQFLATMSHELRTPMNSIIGYSELLLDGIDGEMNEDQREDVKAVLRSAEHLLKLINDVLDLSKIEAGHMKVEIRDMRIEDAAKEVAELVAPKFLEKNLRLETVIIDRDVEVKGDFDRVKQILLNLVGNAVKFTDTGGVTVRIMKDDEYGIFSVEDTGMGIPEEHLRLIFEEFHQVDSATTRKHGGTGLGLAIVRRLCDLMGGSVSVSSQLGTGSIFHVKIPLSNPNMKEKPESLPAILLVDDDQETVSLFMRYLTKENIGIISARSAADARRLLDDSTVPERRLTRFRGVILDVQLPDGTGYDVLRYIKSHKKLKDLPTGVVTITDDDGLSASLGAAAHIVKPISRADLIDLVNRLLDADAERMSHEKGKAS